MSKSFDGDFVQNWEFVSQNRDALQQPNGQGAIDSDHITPSEIILKVDCLDLDPSDPINIRLYEIAKEVLGSPREIHLHEVIQNFQMYCRPASAPDLEGYLCHF